MALKPAQPPAFGHTAHQPATMCHAPMCQTCACNAKLKPNQSNPNPTPAPALMLNLNPKLNTSTKLNQTRIHRTPAWVPYPHPFSAEHFHFHPPAHQPHPSEYLPPDHINTYPLTSCFCISHTRAYLPKTPPQPNPHGWNKS